MSMFLARTMILLGAAHFIQASLLPFASSVVIISYTNTDGGYPAVPNDQYSMFGHVTCGMDTHKNVHLSDDKKVYSLFTDEKMLEKLVMNIYLSRDPPTGAEMYTFYCDPQLTKGPTRLIKAKGARAGANITSTVPSLNISNAERGKYLWNVTEAGFYSNTALGAGSRLYLICTAHPNPLCWDAKPGGPLTLQPPKEKPCKEQLFAFVFEPVTLSADPAHDAEDFIDNNKEVGDDVRDDDPCADVADTATRAKCAAEKEGGDGGH
ncbi:hypothetical protein B0H17DRAFT_1197554 [Mycena rosella]|uniref:Uncharacterized protein n=1 Tax=Mycena rosella TaxID=1033263 RepID=A0AAD7DQR0_MYCRO|nr:hypothetical protein B0H17DRAFT_1197554 [Mycena rosella]